MRGSASWVVLLALWLLPLQGCSLITVSGRPRDHEHMRYFDCTDDKGAPMADVGWAALWGLVAAAAHDSPEGRENTGTVALMGTLAVLHGGSAIYGFIVTGKCREAEQAMEHRLNERDRATENRIIQLEQQVFPPPVGCTTDADCRTDRICDAGKCIAVPSPPAPTPTPPAPTTPTTEDTIAP